MYGKSQGTTPYENWLEPWDWLAEDLPRASDWLQPGYAYFIFARYPHLRPIRPNRDEAKRSAWETGRREFWQTLDQWRERIENHPKAARLFEGLTRRSLRYQLAAHTVETVEALQEFQDIQKSNRHRRSLLLQIDRRNRMLQRHTKKAIGTLEKIRDYAASLDPILGGLYQAAASSCLDILSKVEPTPCLPPRIPTTTDFLSGPYENPADSGTVQVYWFFRDGCGLSGDEAEIRAATIRNEFWVKYGATHFYYRAQYSVDESKGCDAVRQLVRRAPTPPGTTR